MSRYLISILLVCFSNLLSNLEAKAQASSNQGQSPKPELVPPIAVEREKRIAGNPLATYAAVLALEDEYRKSKVFSAIYDEQRLNLEEFFGVPEAGLKALQLPAFKKDWSNNNEQLAASVIPISALDVIKEEAKKTKIVIWGEEHHLPQTRSLYEPMIRELWNLGYRYLAAESFTDKVMRQDFHRVDYESGYYTQDPVFASAVNLALELGYKLISYDNKERSDTEPSMRDIRQAENIKARSFDKDPSAKVLILAGRGHASEMVAPDGWKPMASVLKRITGIDPFTVYAPTMTERLTRDEEHPWYRDAIKRGMVNNPNILKDTATARYVGTEYFDAYVFFPPTNVVFSRPEWMFTTLGRKPVKIPKRNLRGSRLLLVQAFREGDPPTVIPADQLLIHRGDRHKYLALPPGAYRIRSIAPDGRVLAVKKRKVR